MKRSGAASSLKKFLPPVVLCIAVIIAVGGIRSMRLQVVTRLDSGIYDIYLRSMLGGEMSPVPVLIDIDDKSLRQLGQWPWPRYVTAEIMASLYEAGARAVGMDILLTEPDRTSISVVSRDLAAIFGLEVSVAGVDDTLQNNDEYFAMIMSQIPSIAAVHGLPKNEQGISFDIKPFPVTEIREPGAPPLIDFLPEYSGALVPIKVIGDAVTYHASINSDGDSDAVFRRVPLIVNIDGHIVPSLAIAALATAAGDKGIVVHVSRYGPISLKVAGIEIPLSGNADLPIAFRGPGGTAPTYSAADVWNGTLDQSLIAGRIAFLGSTSEGLKDLRPTPIDRSYPGLEFHAATIDTILSERFIVNPDWDIDFDMVMIPLLAVVMTALFWSLPPKFSLPLMGLAQLIVWGINYYAMTRYGFWISPLYALLSIILAAFTTFSLRFVLEERDERVLRRAFSNYVSPEIVGRIVERGGVASLAGETRPISVLFTDIRGFTSMTEKMSPTDVSALLGMYFTPMTQIVRQTHGTLDKFVGDALMAFWNAPLDVPDHPIVAVGALLEMQTQLKRLNDELIEPRFGIRLRMGGGIHTGDAHVGNMGTADLMDYTAIGDTVNTASRVEGMCSKYGMGVVVSGDTADALRGDSRFVVRTFDLVRLKGRASGIPICTVYDRLEGDARRHELELWSSAFDDYVRGDFAEAERRILELREMRPSERLYEIFAERAEHMLREPPSEWDGVYTYVTK